MNSLTLALAHAEELLNSRKWVQIITTSRASNGNPNIPNLLMHYGDILSNGDREKMIASRHYYETKDAVEYVTHTHY